MYQGQIRSQLQSQLHSNSQTQSQSLKVFHIDQFKCTLCQNWFCPPFNLPYLLPCTHSICTNCIQNTKQNNKGKILCPIDGQTSIISQARINQITKKALQRLMKQHNSFNQHTQLDRIKSLSLSFDQILLKNGRQMDNLIRLIDQIFQSQIKRLKMLWQRVKKELSRPQTLIQNWKQQVKIYLSNIKNNYGNLQHLHLQNQKQSSSSFSSTQYKYLQPLNNYIQQGRKIKMQLNQFFEIDFNGLAQQIVSNPKICLDKRFSIQNIIQRLLLKNQKNNKNFSDKSQNLSQCIDQIRNQSKENQKGNIKSQTQNQNHNNSLNRLIVNNNSSQINLSETYNPNNTNNRKNFMTQQNSLDFQYSQRNPSSNPKSSQVSNERFNQLLIKPSSNINKNICKQSQNEEYLIMANSNNKSQKVRFSQEQSGSNLIKVSNTNNNNVRNKSIKKNQQNISSINNNINNNTNNVNMKKNQNSNLSIISKNSNSFYKIPPIQQELRDLSIVSPDSSIHTLNNPKNISLVNNSNKNINNSNIGKKIPINSYISNNQNNHNYDQHSKIQIHQTYTDQSLNSHLDLLTSQNTNTNGNINIINKKNNLIMNQPQPLPLRNNSLNNLQFEQQEQEQQVNLVQQQLQEGQQQNLEQRNCSFGNKRNTINDQNSINKQNILMDSNSNIQTQMQNNNKNKKRNNTLKNNLFSSSQSSSCNSTNKIFTFNKNPNGTQKDLSPLYKIPLSQKENNLQFQSSPSPLVQPTVMRQLFMMEGHQDHQIGQQMLLSQGKQGLNFNSNNNHWSLGNANFLKQWQIQRNRPIQQVQIKQRSSFNCQKQKQSYIRRIQYANAQQAYNQTQIRQNGTHIQLVGYSLQDIDMNLFLQHFNWNQIQVVKIVKAGLQDQQLNPLLNFILRSSVHTLVLSQNGLTQSSIDAFLYFFEVNSSLKSVYLGTNNINTLKSGTKTKINMLKEKGINIYI